MVAKFTHTESVIRTGELLQDLVDGEEALSGKDSFAFDIENGLVFTAGAEVALASGEDGSIAIENPSDSGKTLAIVSFSVYHSVTDSLDVVFHEDPTVTGGTTLTPFNHNFASTETSSMVVTAGQGILSGGTTLDAHVRSSSRRPFEFDGLIIVPPGTTLGLQLQAPGGLTGGTDVSANVTWKEV